MPRSERETEHDAIRAAQDRFVESWGRMGSAWGISRTMAEVHALLYITGEPLCADDIIDRLNISRGNVSMTLRSLTDWGIVHRAHRRGDRKEYFRAEADVSAMLKTIARERKKRELDPVVATLFDIRDMTAGAGGEAADAAADGERLSRHNQRLDAMLSVFQLLDQVAETLLRHGELPLADALGPMAGVNGEATRGGSADDGGDAESGSGASPADRAAGGGERAADRNAASP